MAGHPGIQRGGEAHPLSKTFLSMSVSFTLFKAIANREERGGGACEGLKNMTSLSSPGIGQSLLHDILLFLWSFKKLFETFSSQLNKQELGERSMPYNGRAGGGIPGLWPGRRQKGLLLG